MSKGWAGWWTPREINDSDEGTNNALQLTAYSLRYAPTSGSS
jgi:hypothetical protein